MPRRLLVAALLLHLIPPHVAAELKSLQVIRREPFADGKPFGDAGPYERITAIARYAVDPNHPRNRDIIDLKLAPTNGAGEVEFEADVFLLAPRDPRKGNGALLYDVNNRGNKLALRMFNLAPGGNDPRSEKDAGDGFLLRRGYTVVWSGWIGELLPGGGRLLLRAPLAMENGKPVRGTVRYEMVADKRVESMPLARRDGHGSPTPTKEGEANGVLTQRATAYGKREVVPRAAWSLERLPVPENKEGVRGTLPQVRLRLQGGFEPGMLYELICEAEGSVVQGLGFAAVRDLVSFLRHDGGAGNPLAVKEKSAITRAHGFGVSQSGRFLRHFLYQGFNADERGRRVFDGLMPHVAGGGLGFFNHRFASPTRHNAQHEEHFYPADVFPFTYGDTTDPFSKRTDGILHRLAKEDPRLLPKVMHTQSAAEYWHRSGSLVHTDPHGTRDADIPEGVRVYAFGGTQHGPAADPPSRGLADNLHNPADYRPFLRALLDALDAWAKDGKEPPASVYPRIANQTLVDWKQDATGFPKLPGVRYPQVIQQPPAADYGPEFLTKGILSIHPPRVLGHYTVRVPRSDADGNDVGTLLAPEVAVPLATYTGWNLRSKEGGADGELMSLTGSYIPFPKTRADREAVGDPRRSVAERYGDFATYRKGFEAACAELARGRYLLAEDIERLVRASARSQGQFPGR